MRSTPQSRKHLRRKLHQIQYETDDDLFEYARHFPHGNKVHRFGAGFEGWAEAEILFAHYAVSWLEANRYALPPAAASGR